MRRALAVITTVGALAVGGSAYAGQAAGTSAPQKAKKAAAQAPYMVSGTIMRFDSTANTLTLSTLNGEETFTIGSTAMLHQGRKPITTSALTNLAGYNVTVRYAQSAGERTVESVDISRRAASSKPTATSGTVKQ